MSVFLPILGGQPTGANAFEGIQPTQDPLAETPQEQSKILGHEIPSTLVNSPSAPIEAPAFLKQLQMFVSKDIQRDGKPQDRLIQEDILHLGQLVQSGAGELVVSAPQAAVKEILSEALISQTAHSESLPGLTIPHQTTVPTVMFSDLRESHHVGVQRPVFLPTSLPVNPLKLPQGVHALENQLINERQVPLLKEQQTTSFVKQDLGRGAVALEKVQLPVPREFDAGVTTQQASVVKVSQPGVLSRQSPPGQSGEQPTLGFQEKGESLSRILVQPGKEFLKSVDQIEKTAFQNEPSNGVLQKPPLPQSARSPIGFPNQNLPVTAIESEGPAGFTERILANKISTRPLSGNSLSVHEAVSQVTDARSTLPADLAAEQGWLGKGERLQSAVEPSIKSVGIDSSGGQGAAGMSMNNFSQSQSGFQQSTSSQGQGVGTRALEERTAAFPTPALQRLQMDVQLSENQRVQIDVGVQHRQVYAGLVMDHSVLRNLAAQFVPQLENQLAQADLDLQEFSAEVREEGSQDEENLLHHFSQPHDPREGRFHSENSQGSLQAVTYQQEEPGVHFVA